MSHTSEKTDPGGIALKWWLHLHPDQNGRGGDRAALARLRRCETPSEALLDPEAMRLLEMLRADDWTQNRINRALSNLRWESDGNDDVLAAVGAVAALLAGIRPGEGAPARTSFAERLGQTSDGRRPGADERATLSAARFTSLVRSYNWDERLRLLRRAVRQLDRGLFDVAGLSRDLLRWDERTRRCWTFAYHQQLRAAPDASISAAPREETTQ